jgi:cytochrome b
MAMLYWFAGDLRFSKVVATGAGGTAKYFAVVGAVIRMSRPTQTAHNPVVSLMVSDLAWRATKQTAIAGIKAFPSLFTSDLGFYRIDPESRKHHPS